MISSLHLFLFRLESSDHFSFLHQPAQTSTQTKEKMKKVNVLMIGTGEYTTGIVQSATEPKKEGEEQQHQVSKSDKKLGVVGVVSFDLRRRGLVDRLLLAGQRGSKMQQIRDHWNSMRDVYASIDTEFEAFPKGLDTNPNAYLDALLSLSRPPSCLFFCFFSSPFTTKSMILTRKRANRSKVQEERRRSGDVVYTR